MLIWIVRIVLIGGGLFLLLLGMAYANIPIAPRRPGPFLLAGLACLTIAAASFYLEVPGFG